MSSTNANGPIKVAETPVDVSKNSLNKTNHLEKGSNVNSLLESSSVVEEEQQSLNPERKGDKGSYVADEKSCQNLGDPPKEKPSLGRQIQQSIPNEGNSKLKAVSAEKLSRDLSELSANPKLLLVYSSRVKNHTVLKNAILPHVKSVQYKYEGGSLDSIFRDVSQVLAGCKVESVALIPHSKPGSLVMCSANGKKEAITSEGFSVDSNIYKFLQAFVELVLDTSSISSRIDFLACSGLKSSDIQPLTQVIHSVTKVTVGVSKDALGSDIPFNSSGLNANRSCVGDLYFTSEKLRRWSPQPQSLAGFERIRTVGKGAYGAAVLYRKKDDDSLVILKEINMHDLNANERQMALNEIRVLSMLDHPNIISYYDSFEEDGTLMIEMEYADGGTLAQYLTSIQGKRELEEQEILGMFQEMVAGIRHIHEHKILHRDLKTANIFLTKDGIVKIGDFGISKVLTSQNPGANTVLGTPYYISPEICEGKPYDEKSDIWSLGCILYEMACLQRTFEGTNLPALVNKIMKGQFTPVKGNYSPEFKTLVQDMLQREPEYRPSANELLFARLPMMMKQYMDPTTDVEEDLGSSVDSSTSKKRKMRSVLYHIDTSVPCMPPVPARVELPMVIKIRQVAVSVTHTLLVTYDRDVYSWGDGKKGQLGHGDLEGRCNPQRIDALKGKSITRVCCGYGFSVFGSDNGIVMTCGDGSHGCLGHGDWSNALRPRLIENLLSVDVTCVACGPHHVVAIGSDGEVFSWGKGKHGRLGLGSEVNFCEPQEVNIQEPVMMQEVKCGLDGTMFISDVGTLLACGNNSNNKLGLNNRQGFLMAMKNIFSKTEVEGSKIPTIIKPLSMFKAIDVFLGPYHSAVLVEPGIIYTFGKNTHGQLGMNNTKPRDNPMQVKAMADKLVMTVACGEEFTLAGTDENMLYFWGKGLGTPDNLQSEESTKSSSDCASLGIPSHSAGGHKRTPSMDSAASVASNVGVESNKPSKPEGNHLSFFPSSGLSSTRIRSAPPGGRQARDDMNSDVFLSVSPDKPSVSPGSSNSVSEAWEEPTELPFFYGSAMGRRQLPSTGSQVSVDSQTSLEKNELYLQPTVILQLGSESFDQMSKVESYELNLHHIICQGENIYLHVETTCPLPKRRSKRKKKMLRRLSSQNLPEVPDSTGKSTHSNDGGDEYTSSEASELDTLGAIPTWIQKELNESILPIKDLNAADQSDKMVTNDETHQNSELKDKVIEKPESVTDETKSVSLKNKSTLSKEKDGINQDKETPILAEKSDAQSNDSGADAYKKTVKGKGRGMSNGNFRQSKVSVPGAPKQLGRFRAGKGRAKASSWTIEGAIREPPKTEKQLQDEAFAQELKRLEEDKKKAEQKLQHLEEQNRKQQEELEMAAKKEAEEREKKMKAEIDLLRSELQSQSKQMASNNNVMIQLQEQLVKMQSEQLRLSAREKRASSAMQQQKTRSRLCSIS